ncbi:beta-N-acetylhexosaminidase [Larkinella terrae]|uniref:beta-N-acetylhexosaminidase n=1 Tax=Larkinella terrae TaxID=2025311 RepID=A0A7K0EW63_9BACT|nr:beta-N-acetylhexosaminidase [Larkinella terrae]MRS65628.1 family 20 glycosylhydrolase [Larkinella terrae]
MKNLILRIVLLCLTIQFAEAQTNRYALIPQPVRLDEQKGSFKLPANLVISIEASNPEVRRVAEKLAAQLTRSTGRTPQIKTGKGGAIVFTSAQSPKLGNEGYFLNVTPKRITLTAQQPNGFFYAVQSLLQLMPAEVFGTSVAQNVDWSVPCCLIEDQPRYGYRGVMLDVSRHFYPVPAVKKFIDQIALHKINTFHWHLTDDQGWRIEIKKHPKLTEIGSTRKETMLGQYRNNKYDKTPYGGFYTQDEIRDVIRYAQERFITIVPEIEMPGHAMAILSAYPQLGSSADKIVPVTGKWGVHEDVLFPREETFQFLQEVLTEVIDLFPGQYIHIGGDECPKTQWIASRFCQDLIKKLGLKDEHELQSYFIGRIDKFVTSKGRKMIGWDEILEGGLSPNATVMSWRGVNGGIAAARQNHDAIMTPTTYYYLDYYQADPKTQSQPLSIGGLLPLEKTYSYDPAPDSLTAEQQKHIIGVQANLWTEYVKTPEHVEYMLYPRALAMAETGWSPKDRKNIDDFKQRLEVHKKRLDVLGINYFGAPINNNFMYSKPDGSLGKL